MKTHLKPKVSVTTWPLDGSNTTTRVTNQGDVLERVNKTKGIKVIHVSSRVTQYTSVTYLKHKVCDCLILEHTYVHRSKHVFDNCSDFESTFISFLCHLDSAFWRNLQESLTSCVPGLSSLASSPGEPWPPLWLCWLCPWILLYMEE